MGDRETLMEAEGMVFMQIRCGRQMLSFVEGRYCELCGDCGGSGYVFGRNIPSKLPTELKLASLSSE